MFCLQRRTHSSRLQRFAATISESPKASSQAFWLTRIFPVKEVSFVAILFRFMQQIKEGKKRKDTCFYFYTLYDYFFFLFPFVSTFLTKLARHLLLLLNSNRLSVFAPTFCFDSWQNYKRTRLYFFIHHSLICFYIYLLLNATFFVEWARECRFDCYD